MAKQNSISKQINKQRILELLRTENPLSRAEIARRTGLSKATVSRLIHELEVKGSVKLLSSKKQGASRKSLLFDFNTDFQCIVGIELHHKTLHGIATNLEAKPLNDYILDLPDTSVGSFMTGLGNMLKMIHGDVPSSIAGISIAIQGICDNSQGVVIQAENLGWFNVPLAHLIMEKYGFKVGIVNRANAAALGEYWYGAGKDARSLVYIHIGSGVGSGLVYEGRLILGANNAAGEVGHICVLPSGPRCRCGNRGCLEAVASASAITDKVKILARGMYDKQLEEIAGMPLDDFSPIEVASAANAGNDFILDVMKEIAEYFGIAIGALVSVFNPECIVIGGMANYLPESFMDQIRKYTLKHSFPITYEAVTITRSELGQNAVAIGAAALLVNERIAPYQASPI